MSRLGYDGGEGIYFDRTKVVDDPDMVDEEGNRLNIECDPVELCEEIESQLRAADKALSDWANEASWATGPGDTLADMVREMQAQQESEKRRSVIGLETALDLLVEVGGMRDYWDRFDEALSTTQDGKPPPKLQFCPACGAVKESQ
jgi:hypothetical protein